MRGKDGRQLCKLWRFEGGMRPTYMCDPVLNGVGNTEGDGIGGGDGRVSS